MTRNHQIDNLRAVAIISVVLGHSIILFSSSWNIYHPAQPCIFLDYLYKVINIYQMPLFFSISGYLMAASNSVKPFFCFIKAKFKHLLVPFFVIGIFYMIPIKMLLHHPAYINTSFINSIIKLVIGSESGHLWFLPTLFIIFIISYLILYLSQKASVILPICFVFSLILYLISDKIPNIGVPFQNNVICSLWSFLFGAIIIRYNIIEKVENFSKNKAKPLIIIISLLSIITVLIINRFTIISSIITVIAFYFTITKKENKYCQKISSNSFGIYLLHSPLIYITFHFLSNFNPILICLINFIGFGVIAYVLTELINRTKIKFIIGS